MTAFASFGCGAALLLAGLAAGGAIAYAGWCLLERRRYRFCLFAAGLACLFLPIGTILGAVTLTLLSAPETKALFADG